MNKGPGKQRENFDFTPEGESLSYFSLNQALVQAMRVTSDIPGDYGSNYPDTSMAFDEAQSEDCGDQHVITLGFRPQGEFAGEPSQ
jgi:hypothetical protein